MRVLSLIVLFILSIVIWLTNYPNMFVDENKSTNQIILSDNFLDKYGHLKRIELLGEMYKEIDTKLKQADDPNEYIMGNDRHLIINSYYHTKILILNEIHQQHKLE